MLLVVGACCAWTKPARIFDTHRLIFACGMQSGHPALIGRHGPYAVTEQAAHRWLHHMEAALDSVPEIDADSKARMRNFFRYS